MNNTPHEPNSPAATPRPCSTPHSAPAAWLRSDPPDPEALRVAIELVLANPEAVAEILTRARPAPARHNGWTGERMAAFLETLANTGIISEACRAAGMSRESAYNLRDRDPVFAAALAAAQARAAAVVADGLLERSITGTVEHYYRDGVLVGERRHYESWLGLAVLKRLDKKAAEERADRALSARIADHWSEAMDALRSDGTALMKAHVDKVDTPPPPWGDLAENCWENEDGAWMTSFPPPAGFAGSENTGWDGFSYYERECTSEEIELLEATADNEGRADRAEAEGWRDSYFATLRSGLRGSA